MVSLAAACRMFAASVEVAALRKPQLTNPLDLSIRASRTSVPHLRAEPVERRDVLKLIKIHELGLRQFAATKAFDVVVSCYPMARSFFKEEDC